MKNLNKVLSVLLAGAMATSLLGTAIAADADFKDASEINNTEAVSVLSILGVINGQDDGNFNPTGKVTRGEMAKMITVALLGDAADVSAFNDIKTNLTDNTNWAKAYVNYCYSQGIIAGKGNNTFAPTANVTAAEAAKMLLVAIGYNAEVQGYVGDKWMINTVRDAQLKRFFEDLSVSSEQELTREQAAQMIYNAIVVNTIEKSSYVDRTTGNVTDVYNSTGDPLLEKTFGAYTHEGYLTSASYNSATKKFTYEIDEDSVTPDSDGDEIDAYSTEDSTSLLGQPVKVLYKVEKNGDNTVYGFYATGDIMTTTTGDFDKGTTGDKKFKVSGTEYKLSNNDNATTVYYFNSGVMTDTTKEVSDLDSAPYGKADTVTFVDENKDGKYDYAIVTPVTVAEVSYVGTKSITAGGVYTFEDDTIYDGATKGDWVAIVDADQNVYGTSIVTKIDTVEGTVTAMKNTSDVQVNGNWYARVSGTAPSIGETVKLAVVGGYYYDVEVVDSKSLDNVLMVLDAGMLSGGLSSGAETKVMYAKDGTVATVKVSKTEGTKVTAVDANYGTAGHLVKGGMYTFKEKDGALELTKLSNNVIGSYSFVSTSAAYDDDEINSTDPGLDGGYNIADDTIVMVYDSTNNKYSYITGKELKSWTGTYGSTLAQALYTTVNGVKTAVAVTLLDSAAIPASVGTTGFGYVVGTTYYTEENDTGYAVMTLWTNEGEVTVKAEGHDGSTNTAPTAALVSSEAEYVKGAYVTYRKLGNGNIDQVDALTVGTNAKPLTGMMTDKNGDMLVSFDGGSSYNTVDEDTVILTVNSDKKTGVEGDSLILAQETAISGKYVKNAMVKLTGNHVDAIILDVNNNLATNASTVTAATGSLITAINLGTNSDELKLKDTGNTGSAIASEAASWVGAVGAVVLDNSGNAVTAAKVTTSDTLRVVAEDGTVFDYVINTVAD